MSALPPSATVATPFVSVNSRDILQSARVPLDPPKADEVWSTWYKEADDKFLDFRSFDTSEGAAAGAGGPISGAPRSSSHRTLSARQISGQFEEEVVQSWEEDWEDEDVEDTFDAIMGQIARYEATVAASSTK